MHLTDYHAKYFAHELTKRCASDSIEKIAGALVDAQVDLNPHQVDAALFAFASPLSKSAILYGQAHDVVVVNFLNQTNAADQRVFELLSQKFQLFEGVFGASDEVLGAIESGVDFEKPIAGIYQRCRRPEEIQSAFDELQRELDAEIDMAMTRTRQQLLDNFDDEVREKLKVRDADSKAYLNRFERLLMGLTRHKLRDHADFVGESSFRLKTCPFPGEIPIGLYELPRRSGEAHLYRMSHPLAEAVLARAKERSLATAEVRFDYSDHGGKVSVLEPLVGKSGWLSAGLLTVESLDQAEDHMILVSSTDDGQALDAEAARRMLSLPGCVVENIADTAAPVEAAKTRLGAAVDVEHRAIRETVSQRNAKFFEAEAEKLEDWADDIKLGLEREIKELDRQIKEARRTATAALSLEDKLAGQKQIKALEAQRGQKRRSLFDAQDEVERQRDQLITGIEAKLTQKVAAQELFFVRWRLA